MMRKVLHGAKKWIQSDLSEEEAQETQQPTQSVHKNPRQTKAKQPDQIGEETPETAPGPSQTADESSLIVDVEDLEAGDVVIAIMGPTGSGKSTFISSAIGRDTQGVGHELRSYTSRVQAIRFKDEKYGQNVVLVDTPGFDDTFKSDLDILKLISDWLSSSYHKNKLLSGILYLHRITDNRMAGTPLRNLRLFRKLCGRDALNRVYLVTTMWDEVDEWTGNKRQHELETEYWRAMIARGAMTEHCRNNDDSARDIIQRILQQEDARRVLLLQEEMANQHKELRETTAGQQLYSELDTLAEKQRELLRRINKERKAASGANTVGELQMEYDDLRKQIDDKLRQMEELKLSRLNRLLRLISLRWD